MVARKKLDTIITCSKCGASKIVIEYYSYKNKIFNGTFPVCKSCLEETFKTLISHYNGDSKAAAIHLCIHMDIPFDRDTANRLLQDGKEVECLEDFLNAIIRSCGRKEVSGLTKDSIEDIIAYNKNNLGLEADFEDIIGDFKVTRDMYARWGQGFSKQDIFYLESSYKELVETYGGELPTQRSLYKDYAMNELRKKEALEAGRDDIYMKYQTAQSKLMADARLKPTQESVGANDDMLVGMFIKNIEENRPIAEADEKFKDVDGIRKIINEEFIDTLKRSYGGVLK